MTTHRRTVQHPPLQPSAVVEDTAAADTAPADTGAAEGTEPPVTEAPERGEGFIALPPPDGDEIVVGIVNP